MSGRDDTTLMSSVLSSRLVSTSQLCILTLREQQLLLSRPQTHSQRAALPLSIHQLKSTDHQYLRFLLPRKHPSSLEPSASPSPPFHQLLMSQQPHPFSLFLFISQSPCTSWELQLCIRQTTTPMFATFILPLRLSLTLPPSLHLV